MQNTILISATLACMLAHSAVANEFKQIAGGGNY